MDWWYYVTSNPSVAVRLWGLLLVVVGVLVSRAKLRWVAMRLVALIMIDVKLIDLDNAGFLRLEVYVTVCSWPVLLVLGRLASDGKSWLTVACQVSRRVLLIAIDPWVLFDSIDYFIWEHILVWVLSFNCHNVVVLLLHMASTILVVVRQNLLALFIYLIRQVLFHGVLNSTCQVRYFFLSLLEVFSCRSEFTDHSVATDYGLNVFIRVILQWNWEVTTEVGGWVLTHDY